MIAAKNVGMWHRGVEREAEALDSAWRRADLRQSNVQRQREVSEFVQELRVRFCFGLPCSCDILFAYRRGVRYGACSCFLFFIFIFRQLTPRDAPPCVCIPNSLICFDCCPPFPPSFSFAVWRTRCSCPCFPIWVVLNCLYGCLSCPTRIICGCPWFISLFVSWLFLLNPSWQ